MNPLSAVYQEPIAYYSVESVKTFAKAGSTAMTLASGAFVALIVAVAHPIIGPIASMSCLLTAGQHHLAVKHHWRHSHELDSQGKRIVGTALSLLSKSHPKSYHNKVSQYTRADLLRLEHESKRLKNLEAKANNLKWARAFAKSSLPIIGPFWAFFSERNKRSKAKSCSGCKDHWDHQTPAQRLNIHIAKLKSEKIS